MDQCELNTTFAGDACPVDRLIRLTRVIVCVKDPSKVGQKFRHQAESWVEQRMYGTYALDALKRDGERNRGVVEQILKDLADSEPQVIPMDS